MKVVVLNGSPKGPKSVTLQYLGYLEKVLGGDRFESFNVGQELHRLETDGAAFGRVMDAVRCAQLVVWCTPVYYFLVPGQLKRFIELITERGAQDAFRDKYTTAVTTSVHFFDHTAHHYLHAVSEDLGARYIVGYSAAMRDLLSGDERRRFVTFGRYTIDHVLRGWPVNREYMPLPPSTRSYAPDPVEEVPKTLAKKVVVFTDARQEDANLSAMTEVFVRRMSAPVDIVNLHDIPMRGGCLGCCRCAYDNVCGYADGFSSFVEEKLFSCDLYVIAGTIRDRYLSAKWKMFFDRLFFKGHCPTLQGKQVAHLVSGPMLHLPNLREALEGFAEISRANNLGMVSDDGLDGAAVTEQIRGLADRASWALTEGLSTPGTFLRAGGHRIFRDLVSSLGWFFQADRRYYTKHGLLDYPGPSWKDRAFSLFMSLLTRFKGPRKSIYDKSVDRMVQPFRELVERDPMEDDRTSPQAKSTINR